MNVFIKIHKNVVKRITSETDNIQKEKIETQTDNTKKKEKKSLTKITKNLIKFNKKIFKNIFKKSL